VPRKNRPLHQEYRHISYLVHLRNLAAVAHEIGRGHEPQTPALAKLTGVDPRTVGRYLRTLRDFGAPLAFNFPNGGYRFARPWSFETGQIEWLQLNRLRLPTGERAKKRSRA
jgi:hypothetical protein